MIALYSNIVVSSQKKTASTFLSAPIPEEIIILGTHKKFRPQKIFINVDSQGFGEGLYQFHDLKFVQ